MSEEVEQLRNAITIMRRWLGDLATEDRVGPEELSAEDMCEQGCALDFALGLKKYARDARVLLEKVCTPDGRSESLRVELELSHLRQCRALLNGILEAQRPEWESYFAVYEEQLSATNAKIRELEAEPV